MQEILSILLIVSSFFTPKQAEAKQQQFIRSGNRVTYMSSPITPKFQQTITFKKVILTPTLTPTPTRPVSQPNSVVQPSASPISILPNIQESGDEKKDFIMKKINEYRASKGLSSVSTNKETCDFAKTRAGEIVVNFSHDGFTQRINNNSLPYDTYHEVTENIAMTSDYKEVVTMWINSSGHAENMRKNTPFVCVENNGNYYAYEGLRS